MIKSIMSKSKEGIFSYILAAIYARLNPIRLKSNPLIREIVSNGKGIEIGGLSPIFQKDNIIPIYPIISSLDNCNFSNNTIWEGNIDESLKFFYDDSHAPGIQFLLEATDLALIKNKTYDFLLSSHMIEHTANPIKALKEWKRVIKENGHMILCIPHKDGTFDHKRPVATLDHLIKDYENDITEKDLTHLDEILELHDLSMDVEAGTHQQFSERSLNNYENRCLHHHVFDTLLVVQLLNYLNLQIKAIEGIAPLHILVVVQKLPDNKIPNNEGIIKYVQSNDYKSPFRSDKI